MSNSSREGGLWSQQSTRRRFLSGAGKAAAAAGVGLGVPGFLEACATGTGTASTTTSAKDLTIGYAIGESGLLLPYDVPVADMGQLAIDDLNAKGGILGHKIQTVRADTKSVIENAAPAALEVVNKGSGFMVATADYDFGAGAALVAQQHNIVVFTIAGSTKWGVQGIGPMAFTMSSCANTQAASTAEWAYKQKGWKKVWILGDTVIAYQKDFTNYFQQRWNELAGPGGIVGMDTFKNPDPSIAPQIARLKALPTQPDYVLLISFPPGGATAIRQLRSAGVTLPIMGVPPMDGNYWLDAVPGLSDFFYVETASVYGDDGNKKVNDLVTRFTKKTGQPPAIGENILGYAIVEAFARAAQMANSLDGNKVRLALESFRNVPLVCGPTSFTADKHYAHGRGNAVLEVQNGKHRFVTYFTPEKVPEPQF
jgi:branched-chain amino acid transport system substrate-binding protein